jgi:hypothetical protein
VRSAAVLIDWMNNMLLVIPSLLAAVHSTLSVDLSKYFAAPR